MHVDPRADRIAINLGADALEDIAGRRIRHGLSHYEAREAVLRDLSGEWTRQAGKATADRVVRGLHYLSADECLSGRERGILRDREREHAKAEWVRITGRPLAWYNRLSFALWGVPLL
ncbi:hypothetical protein MKK58_00320 [Methylobacterium sp. J-078]|uniref:hypothetical protein n=1 Tax=Methylobacterium sp. J-078 TaxID=2836657 RepID=UPI001FB8EF13|nr:hypothetical protein [Methylobacterium sp. J-078]MCJ2043004.1 hypothetical protein [Methylobacterium sp. J-078]